MLHGRTLGVIGVGSIGSRIAKYAKAFNMNVLGVRRNMEQGAEGVDLMHGPSELHSVLAKCDYVVLATPNTKETTGFFGKAELAAMKPSAFLVNIGRAATIEEKPLYEALTSERLRGFGADVWWRYEFGRTFPIGWGSRLEIQRLPNVICSAREAHNADDVLERSLEWGTQNLVEFAAGQPLTREVSLEAGYSICTCPYAVRTGHVRWRSERRWSQWKPAPASQIRLPALLSRQSVTPKGRNGR